ncbi:ATP-binding protein [Ornithinimicrobium cerasi]|uniref:Tetratricopeptide repeat-containing protein n=1 Tax=Ornithinimicrobium cerasi TaxID=2248773 RepID=A0A285VSX6_9MICO|nr:tetratricopeptide repeat protein [Ornithinimicrobium cerasi]SOC57180.1 Tetratricopeptide repeat-containing protein [Ornithinimicrobium cerasi]
MSGHGSEAELEALDRGIDALEQQRAALGDAVVDTALAPLRERRRRLASRTGDRRKLVTVLFSDLVGSTPLTEAIGDEAMREVMRRYFGLWREVIETHGGQVEKFIGDAVVGVFGMERAREDDPHRAVRAAVAVRPALERLSRDVLVQHGHPLRTRVGIDTGEVVLGRFDELGDGDLVVVGGTVNRAARLQTAAPPDGILLSAATARHVRGSFGLREHGELDLRGLDRPVRTFLVHSAAEEGFWSTARGLEGISTRTVGRDLELQLLTRLFEDVLEERSSTVVTVLGDAGIGKSRLLADLESWLAGLSEPVWLLRGRADAVGDRAPHALLRSAFAERFAIRDTDTPAEVLSRWHEGMAAMGAGTVPGAEDLLGWLGFTVPSGAAPPEPATLQRRAWAAFDAAVRAMSVEAPVVLLLEDVHWADRPVLDLLVDLQAAPRPVPLLVVATSRPTLLEDHPHWGEGLPGQRTIRLQPLSRRETGMLVTEVLQRADAVPDWVRELAVEAAEGNPFFVEEIIAWLVDTGSIRTGPGSWTVLPEQVSTAAAPGTLRALLEARLDVLTPSERDLVDRASVIGRVFWDTAIEHLAPDRPAPTRETYEALRRREVVHRRPSSAFAQAEEFAFRHALLRDVAYDCLLTPERQRYHARAADWVREMAAASGRPDEHAASVAHHLLQAGQDDAAAGWLLRAARHAARTYANNEALGLLTRAVEVTRDEELLFEVLLEQESLLDRTGLREEQRGVLDRLDGVAGEDPGRRARVLLARGRWAFFHAEYADAARVAEEAARMAREAGLGEEEVEASVMRGRALAFAGEHAAARRQLETTLPMARDGGTPRLVGETLRLLGVVATNLHEEKVAVELLERSAEAFEDAGDDEGLALVSGQLGVVLMLGGRMAEARRHLERALAVFTASGHLLRQGTILGNITSIALDTGSLDEGLALARRSLELGETVDDVEGVVSSLLRLGEVERLTGSPGEARAHLVRAVDLGRQHGLHYFVAHALCSLSALALDQDDPAQALGSAREARVAAELSEVPVALAQSAAALGLAALAVGDAPVAVAALADAGERTRALGLRLETVEAQAMLAEAQLLAGRPDLAGSLARRALVAMGPDGPTPFGELHPGRGVVACHRVLSALQDPWAGYVGAVAGRVLARRSSMVSDAAVRERFLSGADCRALAAVASQCRLACDPAEEGDEAGEGDGPSHSEESVAAAGGPPPRGGSLR